MQRQPWMTEWIQKLNWIGNDFVYIYYGIYGVLCFIFDSNFLWYCFVDFLCRLLFCSYYCMLINQSVLLLLDTQHWINIVIKFIKSVDTSSQIIGIKKIEKTQNLHGVLFTVQLMNGRQTWYRYVYWLQNLANSK